jgi:hypothetical protein
LARQHIESLQHGQPVWGPFLQTVAGRRGLLLTDRKKISSLKMLRRTVILHKSDASGQTLHFCHVRVVSAFHPIDGVIGLRLVDS